MSHLSTTNSQVAMVFYSLLTFFIAPYFITPSIPGNSHINCIAGFTVGFLISISLWFMCGGYLTSQ